MPGNVGIRPVHKQPLGAGADAAPFDVDDDVLVSWRLQFETTQRELLGLFHDDGKAVHSRPPIAGCGSDPDAGCGVGGGINKQFMESS